MKAIMKRNKGKGWNNNVLLAIDESDITTVMRLDKGDALALYHQLALKDLSNDDHGELTVEVRGMEYTFVEPMWRTIFCAVDEWFESYMINVELVAEL
ncbi:hypothetical protein LCGC14_0534360 [marine sediment metagenome]|uniref:Uncharacterized protein n=1 Tax=marine sediment metagenome TaxID=412755 RepID=A0A0F9SD37_9ZZZZ